MKQLLLAAVITGFFFFGCSDVVTNTPNQPVTSKKTIVKLPAKTGLSKDGALSVTETVNGNKGGTMSLSGSLGDEEESVSVSANLVIPSGAFDGRKDLIMTADESAAGLDFSPSMVFDKSLSLDLTYSGLDLKELGITRNSLGFYYVSSNGQLSPVPNDGITVNFRTGTISVTGAQIDHFSRYAFAQ